jgi:hypothetical protein
MPLEVFYGTDDEPLGVSETVFAQRICQACPVLADCAVDSMRKNEEHGVWASATPKMRQQLLQEHHGNAEQSAKHLVEIAITAGCEKTA